MSNSGITIELLEGETMADALLRIAKEKAGRQDDSQSPPAPKPPKKERKPKAPKPDQPRPVGDLGGDPNEGEPVDEMLFMAVHVYKRKGETDEKARYNARQEREMHGPGTAIFSHLHHFGEKCDNQCKVRVVL